VGGENGKELKKRSINKKEVKEKKKNREKEASPTKIKRGRVFNLTTQQTPEHVA